MDEFDSVQKEAGKLSTEIIIMNHVIWIEKLPNEQKRERKKNKRREFQEAFEEISPKPKKCAGFAPTTSMKFDSGSIVLQDFCTVKILTENQMQRFNHSFPNWLSVCPFFTLSIQNNNENNNRYQLIEITIPN